MILLALLVVILKPCDFSDILFATKTRVANITRLGLNITAKQYHSPKANIVGGGVLSLHSFSEWEGIDIHFFGLFAENLRYGFLIL